jgi:hypothetical protein
MRICIIQECFHLSLPSIVFKLCLLMLTMAFSSAADAEVFPKGGNNGTVNCAAYCTNDGDNSWGPYGTCVRGHIDSGPRAGQDINCGDLPGFGNVTICFCASPAPNPPPAGSFEKNGNNGTVSCEAFCHNAGGTWGRYGNCVGGRVDRGPTAGRPLTCGEIPRYQNWATCYCVPPNPPAGSVEKPGNNGTVSCDTYCRNEGGNWGPYGTCVGGLVVDGPSASRLLACGDTPGHPNTTVCYCLAPPPNPPPAGSFEKQGNNGSVNCSDYCHNTNGAWGRYGDCAGGRVDSGPTAGRMLRCEDVPGVPNTSTCYCNPPPPNPAPAGSFEKAGNNGTVNCSDFCHNTNGAWGRYGDCVGGRVDSGPTAGRSLRCGDLPGFGNSTVCYCNPATPPPPTDHCSETCGLFNRTRCEITCPRPQRAWCRCESCGSYCSRDVCTCESGPTCYENDHSCSDNSQCCSGSCIGAWGGPGRCVARSTSPTTPNPPVCVAPRPFLLHCPGGDQCCLCPAVAGRCVNGAPMCGTCTLSQ